MSLDDFSPKVAEFAWQLPERDRRINILHGSIRSASGEDIPAELSSFPLKLGTAGVEPTALQLVQFVAAAGRCPSESRTGR
jgi:hypothetical protein